MDRSYKSILPSLPVLEREEEIDLIAKMHIGCERSRERLLLSHIGLVKSVARRFATPGTALFEDLVSEGQIGLIKAADRFDQQYKVRFSTYARWWVKSEILYFVFSQGKDVRLSQSTRVQVIAVTKATQTLAEELGRPPWEGEIADRLDMPLEELRALQYFGRISMVSLDKPLHADGEESRRDYLPDSTFLSPEEREIAKSELQKARTDLESAFECAQAAYSKSMNPQRNWEMFSAYCAVDVESRPTLDVLSKKYRITREAVRQIVEKGLLATRKGNLRRESNPIFTLAARIEALEGLIAE